MFLAGVRPTLEIGSLPRARRRVFADLGTRAGRERRGRFLLEGPRAIEDALARGIAFEAIVVEGDAEAHVRDWAAAGRLPPDLEVFRAEPRELAALADTTTPQGMLAVGRLPELSLAALPDPGGRVALLVDGLQDPGNLGTLLRTLAAVGGTTAIACRGTVDPFNPKALRAAAGATFAVSIAAGIGRGAALDWCAARGVTVVALDAGAPGLFEARLPGGTLALAVGNEAGGLSDEVVARADARVGLPMVTGVESLSAPVAGSIAMYALAFGLAPRREPAR